MKRLLCVLTATLAAAPIPAAVAAEHAVTLTQIQDRKAVFATVETVHVSLARARIGGTVAALTVREGDRVTAGQKIAVVADPKLVLQTAASDQRLQSAEAERDLARIEALRAEELVRTGAGTRARQDAAKTKLDVAERALNALRSERQVTVERGAEAAVLAPEAGRVLKVPVTAGSVVLPGETVAAIATESYILRLSLPERFARFLKAGDPVVVGARGMGEPGAALGRGTVRLVYPQIEDGRVTADADAPNLGDYFVGERVKVMLNVGSRAGFVVPQAFVSRRFGLNFVRLKGGAEIVVQPGQPQDDGVEILSGLNDGDVLVAP